MTVGGSNHSGYPQTRPAVHASTAGESAQPFKLLFTMQVPATNTSPQQSSDNLRRYLWAAHGDVDAAVAIRFKHQLSHSHFYCIHEPNLFCTNNRVFGVLLFYTIMLVQDLLINIPPLPRFPRSTKVVWGKVPPCHQELQTEPHTGKPELTTGVCNWQFSLTLQILQCCHSFSILKQIISNGWATFRPVETLCVTPKGMIITDHNQVAKESFVL